MEDGSCEGVNKCPRSVHVPIAAGPQGGILETITEEQQTQRRQTWKHKCSSTILCGVSMLLVVVKSDGLFLIQLADVFFYWLSEEVQQPPSGFQQENTRGLRWCRYLVQNVGGGQDVSLGERQQNRRILKERKGEIKRAEEEREELTSWPGMWWTAGCRDMMDSYCC